MKKLVVILNSGLFGRNGALLCAIVAFVLTGFFAASCAKSEIAQDDSIMNPAQAAVSNETQDDPAGDDQGDPSDPSNPDGPAQHGSDYISPDQFNLIPVSFNACADEDNASQGPAQAGAFATKGLFSMEDAASREEPLDEDADDCGVKTTLGDDNKISWIQGDQLKIYYYNGEENYTTATIKHDGATSTFDALINPADKYYYAFYPNNDAEHCPVTTSVTYEGDATYEYGAMTITIPSTQNGAFENCHLAVGKATAEDKQFTFSNVGSYMKLKVANTTATALTIQATNTSDKIVGTFTVPFAEDGLGIDEENISLGECSCSLRVNLPTPREANTVVYVALLPGVDFTDGFRIRYEYGDSKVHPGFAYVKRDNGARTNRQVDRKKILNFATTSVPTLDERIREDYFVKTDGACSDVDVTRAGASWGNALNVTGLRDLLAQPVDGSGNQIYDEDYDRAWMLDGATIHVAEGDYYLAGSAANFEVKMEFTGYTRQVAVTVKGSYPDDLEGTSLAGRDTTAYRSAFTGNNEAGIFWLANQTDLTFDGITFKNARFNAQHAAVHLDSGNSGNTTVTLDGCRFLENSNSDNYSAASIAIQKGTANITNCYFARNYARNGSCINMGAGDGSVTISDCLFEHNSTYNTSGAVQNAGKTATITGCTFDHNTAGDFGGGAFHANGSGSTTTFTDCIFSTNSAVQGGAVSIQSATATFTGCEFSSNSASSGNQGRAGNGEMTESTGTAIVDNVAGGAIVLHNNSANCTLNGCTFTGNTAPNGCGGAIGFKNVAATLNINSGTSFTGNQAYFHGGAIHALGGGFTITGTSASKVTFTNNKTLATGIQYANGGAIWLGSSISASMTYAKFDGCEAGQESGETVNYSNGGAISVNAVTSFTASNCEFTACRGRSGSVLNLALGNSSTCTFTTCNFHDNIGRSGALKNGTSGNFHGGVASLNSGEVTFNTCTMTDNTAYNGAGALYINEADAVAHLNGCTLSGNYVGNGDGGCITVNYGSLDLKGGTVSNNYLSGVRRNGGAIKLEDNAVSAHIWNGCTLSGNSCYEGHGGCICASGGTLTLENSTFSNNQVTSRYVSETHAYQSHGGAFYITNTSTSLTATGCTFTGNANLDASADSGSDPRGGVLCVNSDCNVAFTNCLFSGNHADKKGGVVAMLSAGFLKMNNCLVKENYANTRGMIMAGSNALIYLNRVTFYNNYTTGSNGWGVAVHVGGSTVCMHNVTSIANHCTNNSPGSCFAFNSDGNWMLTQCTLMDNTPRGLLRAGAASKTVTVCNNILMNMNTAANTFILPENRTWNNRGYNYWSSSARANETNHADMVSSDWRDKSAFQYDDGTGTCGYHEVWNSTTKYGVYSGWTYSDPRDPNCEWLLEVTKADRGNPVTTTMGEYFKVTDSGHGINGSSDTDYVGYNFYQWLASMSPAGYRVDGCNAARPEPTEDTSVRWVFGAYQAPTN